MDSMLADMEWRAQAVTTLDTAASYFGEALLSTSAILADSGSPCKPISQEVAIPPQRPETAESKQPSDLVDRWVAIDRDSYKQLCNLSASKPAATRSDPQSAASGVNCPAASCHPSIQHFSRAQTSVETSVGGPAICGVTALSAEGWLGQGNPPASLLPPPMEPSGFLEPSSAAAPKSAAGPASALLEPADAAAACQPPTSSDGSWGLMGAGTAAGGRPAGKSPAVAVSLPPSAAVRDAARGLFVAQDPGADREGGGDVVTAGAPGGPGAPGQRAGYEEEDGGPLMVRPLLTLLDDVDNLDPLPASAGSSGVVSLTGTWRGLQVAVRLSFHHNPEAARPQLRAALLASRLRHPNVLPVLEVRAALVDEASLAVADPPPKLRAGWAAGGLRPVTRLRRFLEARPEFNGMLQAESASRGDCLTIYPGDMVYPPPPLSPLHRALRALRTHAGGVVLATVTELAEMGNLQSLACNAPNPFNATRTWCLPVAQRALIRTAREVAAALRLLHALGVPHGALRPANVLLVRSDADRRGFEARVADFCSPSLARAAVNPWASGPAIVLLAPEALADGAAAETQAADVYSYGMLLYLMAAGEMPFKGEHLVPVLLAVEADGRRPEWPTGQHDHLEPLYRRCVAQRPEDRPTFKQILVELCELEEEIKNPKPY